jgi:RNA polymerase sigma factor (sigma-70 family)
MVGTLSRLRAALGEDMEEVLVACLGGDPSSWDQLLGRVRQVALDLATRSYHLSSEDAEDLAQAVQLRLLERLPQLRQPRAFPRWIWRLIHHMALHTLRQRRPILSLDFLHGREASVLAEATPDPYHQVLLRADLDLALSRLPSRYRRPIELHLLHGLSQDQVGRLLGRPRSTVATQIERGLHRLRRVLAEAHHFEFDARGERQRASSTNGGPEPRCDAAGDSQESWPPAHHQPGREPYSQMSGISRASHPGHGRASVRGQGIGPAWDRSALPRPEGGRPSPSIRAGTPVPRAAFEPQRRMQRPGRIQNGVPPGLRHPR